MARVDVGRPADRQKSPLSKHAIFPKGESKNPNMKKGTNLECPNRNNKNSQRELLLARQERKRGKKKALSVLEAKIGRTVYHLWRKQQAFDAQRFFAS